MAEARVLILEDDGITARYVQGCLRGHGYSVSAVVSSGEEALNRAATLDPDLLVVDIRLRDETMDGVETVRRMRQHSDVPVIYLTGYSDDDTIKRASATSPQGYLVKPFQQRELIAAVEIALRGRTRENRYRAIVEDQVELVCRFRPDGMLTYVNAACSHAFGRPSAALVGSAFWGLIAPPDRDAARQRVTALGPNRPVAQHECRALAMRGPQGVPVTDPAAGAPQLRWQQWTVRAFFDLDGQPIEYQAVGRDVTEQRQRDAERDRRLTELQEALARRQPAQGLVPICASCKRIRNSEQEWEAIEGFLRDHYGIEFTHGLCPECMERLYPGYTPPSAGDAEAMEQV